jgi:ketosteroid isomerase-like protein
MLDPLVAGAPAPAAAPDPATVERLVRDQFAVIETGDLDLADGNVTPDFVNHRAGHEPPAARQRGPEALKATALWLRRAFSEPRFDLHHIEVTGDRATVWATLHATHTGPFVVHDSPDGAVTEVFPPTGRAFAARHVHWFRIADGAIAEHDAVRDDLDMAKQLGWIPPRPAYIARMVLARRRERSRASRPDDAAPRR